LEAYIQRAREGRVGGYAEYTRYHRHICTLFGGANFEGEMGLELVRSMQCIDYAVLGEGDFAFPQLLQALYEERDPAEIPGVVCRRNGKVTEPREDQDAS
jgi:radical SAM superfamily enzyme YgiQ (UPF0313 family)